MLRIHVLGELSVEVDGRSMERIASGRARALLGWLALHPGLHARSRVAAQFWPDILDESARASLRTTLATLRRELGQDAAACIVADRDRVGLDDGPRLWVDVREFERLVAAGRGAQALELRHGDLLSDLDDDWVLEARDAQRQRTGEVMAALGAAAESAGDLHSAVAYSREQVALDPLSEDTGRTLMRRLAASGDRAGAIAAFAALRDALARDLGIGPSGATRALVEEIRAEPGDSVSGPRSPPLPVALTRRDTTPLVGRREALDALHAAWRPAAAGDAAMATIAAEAGGGKTRLIAEFARVANARGARILAGRCFEDDVTPYGPFTEALRQHVSSAGPPSGWVAGELGRLLPELAAGEGPEQRDPRGARHRLFEAVAAVVADAARAAPVILVVEDVHRADDSTLLMLAHVVRTVAWARLFVVTSLRIEERPRRGDGDALDVLLDEVRRERRLCEIVLPGLSPDEVADLASASLGSRAPPALGAVLHRRTGGNPLFVEETVRHLREAHPGAGAEELVGAAGTGVPHGVRNVIDHRIGRLGEPARVAVAAAATAGEAFALDDVVAAAGLTEEESADALDAAVAAQLIEGEDTPGRYRFTHALVRESVLAGLTATRRALLHRRIAAGIERLPGPRRESRRPELARHLLDAHPLVDAGVAADAVLRAGEQAIRQLAYEDAAALIDRGLAELDVEDSPRASLLLALGDARARTGEGEAARRCYDAAAGLARRLGDAELLGRAALGAAGLAVTVAPVRPDVRDLLEEAAATVDPASPLRAALLARLSIELYYGPPSVRERLSGEAVADGRRTGGRALLEALGARHVALWSPDHAEERLAIADELVGAARSTGDREAELQGVNWRVVDLLELGDMPGVLAAIETHARLAEELRLLTYAWYAPMWRAMLAVLGGRIDEAERFVEESARIGRTAHDENAALLLDMERLTIRVAQRRLTPADHAAIEARARSSAAGPAWRAWLAVLALERGDTDEAGRRVSEGAAELDEVPRDANWLYTVTTLGLAAALLDDGGSAARIYPRVLPYADRIVVAGRGTNCTGSVALSLGLLAAAQRDDRAAAAHLERAAAANDRLAAAPYAAAARSGLAMVVGRLGEHERAMALRAQALAAGDELGMRLPDDIVRLL